jgi:predicted DNA-binding transcriptional regulator AlpA
MATCPNCGAGIDLVGAKELREDYGISDNTLTYYKRRDFPDPWLRFGNRWVWLRSDVEAWIKKRERQTIEKAAASLTKALEGLSEDDRAEAVRMLQENIGAGRRS